MRTYSSMQPRAGATLSLKRGRAEGSPLGTPLLGAGLAADSDRCIRRRGEQVRCFPMTSKGHFVSPILPASLSSLWSSIW